MSLKPDGVPVSAVLAIDSWWSLSVSSCEDLGDRPERLLALVLRDLEHRALGPLEQLARGRLARQDARLDLVRGRQQRAQPRVVADDPAVVAGVAGGRHPARSSSIASAPPTSSSLPCWRSVSATVR